MNAHEAIDRSRSRNEIVHLAYSSDDYETLLAECDDSADHTDSTEFWGADWRVHIQRGAQ